jgi:hypothetical protein
MGNGLLSELELQAKSKGLKLDLVNYGISYRFDDIIVMNKNLLKYESYCREVFDHESRHSGELKQNDFIMDLVEGSLLKNLLFVLRHPFAIIHFFPISKYKKHWLIDLNLIGVYIIAFLVIYIFMKVV